MSRVRVPLPAPHENRRSPRNQGPGVSASAWIRPPCTSCVRPATRWWSSAAPAPAAACRTRLRGRRRLDRRRRARGLRQAELVVKVKEPLRRSARCCARADRSSPTSTSPPCPSSPTRCSASRGHRRSPTRRSSDRDGRLPLLTPMSEVAGRMAVQDGAHYLERERSAAAASCSAACPACRRATSSILGGGVVGAQRGQDRGRPRRARSPCSTSTSTACATSTTSSAARSPRSPRTRHNLRAALRRADLRDRRRAHPGRARRRKLVTREMLKR